MMKKLLLIAAAAMVSLAFVGYHASAFDLFGNSCNTTDQNGNPVPVKDANGNVPPACQQAASQTDNPFVHTIDVAANILAVAAGAAAVIMITISALTLVTSGGNTESVTGARRRLTYALIGLFVVAIAWTLTRFITDRLIQ